MAQTAFVVALDRWTRATGAGVAGTECRFRIAPPGEVRRPLVPDVAFLSYRRLPYKAMAVTDEPRIAPDVVVVTVCDARGEQRLDDKEVIRHAALPGFRLAVKTLFELPRPK